MISGTQKAKLCLISMMVWTASASHFFIFHLNPINNPRYKKLTLIAGGTGISPMVQIIRTVVARQLADVEINLIYAADTVEELIFKVGFTLKRMCHHSPMNYDDQSNAYLVLIVLQDLGFI